MKTTLRRIATAAVLAAAFSAAPASAAFISSDIAQSGAHLGTRADTVGTIGTFTFATPASALANITGLSITLTLGDGDTGPGNFDEHQLHLVLDGLDTTLFLDGFGNEAIVPNKTLPLSFSLSDPQQASLAQSLYSALVSDGTLVAEILDLDDDDVTPNGAGESNSRKNFMRLPSGYTATLALTGDAPTGVGVAATAVPEPASLALTGLGLAGLALSRRRRQA